MPRNAFLRHLLERKKNYQRKLSLQTIPEELIEKIVEHVSAKKDLRSMMFTCRTLHRIVEPAVYADYDANRLGERYYGADDSYEGDITLLLRTLLDTPRLRSDIKTLTIAYSRRYFSKPGRYLLHGKELVSKAWGTRAMQRRKRGEEVLRRFQDIPGSRAFDTHFKALGMRPRHARDRAVDSDEELFTILLMLATNIQKLDIELPKLRESSSGQAILRLLTRVVQPEQWPFKPHGFAHLKQLTINIRWSFITFYSLISVLQIPTLRELSFKNLRLSSVLSEPFLPPTSIRSSPITSLTLQHAVMDQGCWGPFFSIFRGLERVRAYIVNRNVTPESTIQSTKTVIHALQSQKDTLQTLHIGGMGQLVIPDDLNHLSPPSFTNFTVLSSLGVQAAWLYYNEAMCQSQPAPMIWELLRPILPKQLQTLDVLYGYLVSDRTLKPPLVDQLPTRNQWMELMKDGSKEFPELRKIYVMNAAKRIKCRGILHSIQKLAPGISWCRCGPVCLKECDENDFAS
jgi:hypothetical protein